MRWPRWIWGLVLPLAGAASAALIASPTLLVFGFHPIGIIAAAFIGFGEGLFFVGAGALNR